MGRKPKPRGGSPHCRAGARIALGHLEHPGAQRSVLAAVPLLRSPIAAPGPAKGPTTFPSPRRSPPSRIQPLGTDVLPAHPFFMSQGTQQTRGTGRRLSGGTTFLRVVPVHWRSQAEPEAAAAAHPGRVPSALLTKPCRRAHTRAGAHARPRHLLPAALPFPALPVGKAPNLPSPLAPPRPTVWSSPSPGAGALGPRHVGDTGLGVGRAGGGGSPVFF